MAKRNKSAAAARQETFENAVVAPAPQATSHATTGTYNAIEARFFDRGDRGIVEPPVYLPYESMAFPILGILFLAGLTAFILW